MQRTPSHQADSILIWTLAILICLGLLMLFTSSMVISKEKTKSETNPEGISTYFLFHQILYGLLPGLFLALIFSRISLTFLKNISFLALILSIFLLFIPLFTEFSLKAGGAARWISIGSVTFQPSEFAKLALIIYLAAFFERKIREKKIRDFKEGVLPFLILLLPFGILLLLQPDMGTLGILSIIALSMFFGAGGKILHTLFIILLGISLVIGASFFFPYQAERILTFLNPGEDILGRGYQVNQALIALGSGGLFGVGLFNSLQKWNFLPQPMSDSIFAVWGEETGLIGCSILVFLFLLLAIRGFIISKRAPNTFSLLLGIGITSWISSQAFLHMMAVCGLIPFTGIPLPFIGYGGSALILSLIGAGILINISKRTI